MASPAGVERCASLGDRRPTTVAELVSSALAAVASSFAVSARVLGGELQPPRARAKPSTAEQPASARTRWSRLLSIRWVM